MSVIETGTKASVTKVITKKDVHSFAEASGDKNPVHVDQDFAENSQFGQPIAHGMLVAGLISAVLGTQLPGPGCIYLSQSLKFRAPVFLNDEITATVEVIDIREDKPIITLATICTKQDGTIVIEGEAVMMTPAL